MKDKLIDLITVFFLVLLASYVATNLDREIQDPDCQPIQLAKEHGEYVLLSVCKTPL